MHVIMVSNLKNLNQFMNISCILIMNCAMKCSWITSWKFMRNSWNANHELFVNYSWIIHEMFMITRSWSTHEQQFSWTVPFNVHEKIHEKFMNIAHDLLFKNAWTLVHELFMNKKVHELIIHELLLSWTVPFNVHAHSWRVHVLLMEVHEQNSWIFHE
jgi:hypothetical protein